MRPKRAFLPRKRPRPPRCEAPRLQAGTDFNSMTATQRMASGYGKVARRKHHGSDPY
jgi:hypothetical protein